MGSGSSLVTNPTSKTISSANIQSSHQDLHEGQEANDEYDDEISERPTPSPSLKIRGQSFFDGPTSPQALRKQKSIRLNIINPNVLDVPKIKDHPINDYVFIKKIGHGAFSSVHKAYLRTQPESKVAIKEVDTSKLNKKQMNDLTMEINILSQLKHPSIVNLHAVYTVGDKMFIVMEYLRGGELLNAICKQDFYHEGDARRVLHQLVSAVHFMHSRNVIHRDIKPENIILENSQYNSKVKLIDFGFAVLTTDKSVRKQAYVCGTPGYLAPEVISDTLYTTACDVWSLGVVMYILLSGTMPFDGNDESKVLRGIYDFPAHLWGSVSSSAKDLITKMLVVNPRVRYSISEVLQHPWMQVPDYKTFDSPEVTQRRREQAIRENDLTENLKALRKLALQKRWRLSILKVQTAVKMKKLGASFRHRVDSTEVVSPDSSVSIRTDKRLSVCSNESDYISKNDLRNDVVIIDINSESSHKLTQSEDEHSNKMTSWASSSSSDYNDNSYNHFIQLTAEPSRKVSSYVSDLPPVQEVVIS